MDLEESNFLAFSCGVSVTNYEMILYFVCERFFSGDHKKYLVNTFFTLSPSQLCSKFWAEMEHKMN